MTTNGAVENFETFDHAIPGVRIGHYVAGASQSVTHGGGTLKEEKQALAFHVVAPRLRFTDNEVHASFPPPDGAAMYALTLPHLVLRRRALPWERCVGADDGTPWLALLVFDEVDLGPGGGAVIATGTGAALAPPTKDDGVRRPAFDPALDEAEAKEACTWLEVSEAKLRALCPTRAELSLLAHVRQVSLEDKAGTATGTGEFAVVVSKRFPRFGANTAVLVSLEGYDDWLAGSSADAKKTVRLAVLHAWQFRSVDNGSGTFAGRVEGIGGRGPLAIPAPPSSDAALRSALAEGFVPIAHRHWDGRKAMSV